ncbi:Ribosome maturation protein SBDS [Entamoeba marina]
MIKQPQGQKVLTNIAVVRLVKNDKKFEIACYPNTVSAWRQGVDMPLNEVLQLTRIYQSVEQGTVAKKADLKSVFKTTREEEIALEILKNGEIQKGEKERKIQLESLVKDITLILTQKLVHKETQRPITMKMAEKLIKDVKYRVVSNKSAKQQALQVIKLLKKYPAIPMERMPMVLRVDVKEEQEEKMWELIKGLEKTRKEKGKSEGRTTYELVIDPSAYHELQIMAGDVGDDLKLEIVSVNQED